MSRKIASAIRGDGIGASNYNILPVVPVRDKREQFHQVPLKRIARIKQQICGPGALGSFFSRHWLIEIMLNRANW